MAIRFHPPQGSVVTVRYEPGFVEPEMVKRRLAIVLSPAIKARHGLCTVVPLSTTPPLEGLRMPYHCRLSIPFRLPKEWRNVDRWVKGDMVCAVGWHRVDLLRLGKDESGKRVYQTEVLKADDFNKVRRCVLHEPGLSALTKHL